MDNVSLKNANSFFREGNFEKALSGYERLMQEHPRLAKFIAGNVERTKRRIAKALESTNVRNGKGAETSDQAAPGIYLADLYSQVRQYIEEQGADCLVNSGPLISIIVTAHNTEEYIESCLHSLIAQSYPNKEIIVIDDCSSDRTASIVRRIAKSAFPIRLYQLNTNLGTYFAKNYGITRCKGEVIFFQDSDDTSHPHRIALQMKLLADAKSVAVRAAYSRVDQESERVIKVNGHVSKLGLITLGVRRSVFEKIGVFNCTTKASDDEFYRRLIRFCGKESVKNLPLPLYYGTMGEGSLFADMVSWNGDGTIAQKPSAARADYVTSFETVHSEHDSTSLKERFSFPRIRDAVPVWPEMTKLCNPTRPVVVSVCSIPHRARFLRSVVESVIGQCDYLNVYLDNYEQVPSFLMSHGSKVTVYRSQELPGLRDNGKFIALEEIKRKKTSAYYVTVDDDIIYPPDYVNTLLHRLRDFEDKVVVGTHGVVLKDNPIGYFCDRRVVYGFEKELESDKLVNVLGTGTVAFNTDVVDEFQLRDFPTSGMADLYFARLCKNSLIPMVCIRRPERWLVEQRSEKGTSLFSEFRDKDEEPGALIRSAGPWGYAAITSLVKRLSKGAAHDRLVHLIPKVRNGSRDA